MDSTAPMEDDNDETSTKYCSFGSSDEQSSNELLQAKEDLLNITVSCEPSLVEVDDESEDIGKINR